MAYCCAQAFSGNSPLLFEAGTGVGKSMAYLVPGIIAAKRFKRQLVVATHTIALQQQIMGKGFAADFLKFSNCVGALRLQRISRRPSCSGAQTICARTG